MPILVPLPTQPAGVAWPTGRWPVGQPGPEVDGDRLTALLSEPFTEQATERIGHTHALVVIHRGRLLTERYGTWFVSELEALEGRTATAITAEDVHLSWSMAKSVLHAVVGLLVGQGRLSVDAPAPVPQWSDPDDVRRAITWDDLLHMRPGLAWLEQYYDFEGDARPDIVQMLYGDGRHDMAAFAAGFPLVTEPGSIAAYTYSSGTSNIIAAAAQSLIGGGEQGMRAFLDHALFAPLGMASARPEFDEAGTFVASSYLYATAQDYARFGLLYLRDGVWDGTRLLPEGWVDHGRRPTSPDEGVFHGAHWWTRTDGLGTFFADGFEGQRIICVPALDVVVVRLGRTHLELAANLDRHLVDIVDLFR